ncbi:MAG: glycoside hydrolase family 31 protein [Bacteroidetes bacterium]|nr:glycoside hydrolase family 31 protein [Bacteroidota bacterium]
MNYTFGSSAEIIYPATVKGYSSKSDKALIWCDKGLIQIIFYDNNIVHFIYYPSKVQTTLPSWGILPSSTVVKPEITEEGDLIIIRSPSMAVHINKKDCSVAFFDNSPNLLLKSDSYSLEPTFISGENTYKLNLSFLSPADENYYGLGQHQNLGMNLRGKKVQGWHDYEGDKGEIIGFPFMVTNKKYAFLLDNTSRVMTYPGNEGKTLWTAEVADAISYFVISGSSFTDIYKGYRTLTGITPLPPKSKLGYMQCKTGVVNFTNQDELLGIARKYREKGYPCYNLVVDWKHWVALGDMDFDRKYWPDTREMNKELSAMNYNVMISCWPRFMKESRNYDIGEKNGWYMKKSDGTTLYGTPEDKRGAVLDITNPDAAAWFWDLIKTNYVKNGFTSYWLDESEPDICPHPYYLYAGTGARIHNLYPYLHAKNVYEGHRSTISNRCFILIRSSYPGSQQWGTTTWSSDVEPTWDYLKRQIPTGLNFCASGMAYWCSDIGGWGKIEWLKDRPKAERPLLIKSDIVPLNTKSAPDYPELYVRWFQFGAFCPVFRAHGSREENEVWSYGPEAEKYLVKYLHLRYRLLPYIYAQAFNTYQTGTPFMRALFLDYPDDKNVADIADEYMFGPSLLIAPVVEQGMVYRNVYLPAGDDWFDFWTNKKYKGGQIIKADAPIDRIPIFVKSGSVIPMGPVVNFTGEKPEDLEVRVYSGGSGCFEVYQDENDNYNYEKGFFSTFTVNWESESNILSLSQQKGNYTGSQPGKKINIVMVKENQSLSEQPVAEPDYTLIYYGEAISLNTDKHKKNR